MKKIVNVGLLISGLLLLVLSGVCLILSPLKLTYLEYQRSEAIKTVSVSQSGKTVRALACEDESGNVPYEILNDVTLEIDSGRPAPAFASLYDRSGSLLAEMEALPSDDSARVSFHIPFRHRPKDPSGCYFVLGDSDGKPINASDLVSCTFSGGSREFFWTGLSVFGIAFALLYLLRIIYLLIRKRCVCEDAWVMAMTVTAASFAVMSVMASECNPTIMDENDNILAGMLQTGRGVVIYRDYIAQHTPFVYWLCAFYSAIGAKSVGQFRLLFELTVSIVWGLTFFRHRKQRFTKAVALFSVISMPVAYEFIGHNAGQILSDNVQAVAMTVLLLELAAYYEDHKVGAGRAVVIALCAFASIGSAFMSVYAIFACMVAFLIEEIRYHLTAGKAGRSADSYQDDSRQMRPRDFGKPAYFVRRYLLIVICALLPWIGAIAYLAACGALKDAWDMAFRFNLEVYADYGLPGGNFLEPFYSGVINCVNLVRESWIGLQTGTAIIPRVIESVFLLIVCILLIAAIFRHGFVQAIGLFLFIEMQATRQAVQFHSIMLWYVVLMFILMELPGMGRAARSRSAGRSESGQMVSGREALQTDGDAPGFREDSAGKGDYGRVMRGIMPVIYTVAILAVFGLPYLRQTRQAVVYRLAPVPAVEMQAVNSTEPGEEIFIEAGMLETDYIVYKGRYPATRLCWTLPWYYEWYGKETVETLRKKGTQILMYKMNPVVWGIEGFAKDMDELVSTEYERVGEMDLYMRKA